MLRKSFSTFLMCLFCTFSLICAEYNVHYGEKGVNLTLCPETTYGKQIMSEWAEKGKNTPTMVAEALYVIPKEEGKTIEYISSLARSFSTMEGLEYYSNTDKKKETLYSICYTVSDQKGKNRVKDDVSGNADGKTIYVLQDDNSFGKSVYEMNFHQSEDELYFTSVNLDALYMGIIKAVSSESLKLTFLIKDGSDEVIFYVLAAGDVASVPFIGNMVKESFVARLDAVSEWFMRGYCEK